MPGRQVAHKAPVYHFGMFAIFLDKSSGFLTCFDLLPCEPVEDTNVSVSGCVDADAGSRCSNAHLCEQAGSRRYRAELT